jgi:hypothetical protein
MQMSNEQRASGKIAESKGKKLNPCLSLIFVFNFFLSLYSNSCQALFFLCFSCYIYSMSITQTVEIPASHRLVIDVPREVPEGRTILTFTPAHKPDTVRLAGGNARTVEEALQMAAEKLADPSRKPLSRHFGKHKGIFGGDGVAYQRAIRDEWD